MSGGRGGRYTSCQEESLAASAPLGLEPWVKFAEIQPVVIPGTVGLRALVVVVAPRGGIREVWNREVVWVVVLEVWSR